MLAPIWIHCVRFAVFVLIVFSLCYGAAAPVVALRFYPLISRNKVTRHFLFVNPIRSLFRSNHRRDQPRQLTIYDSQGAGMFPKESGTRVPVGVTAFP
jgi:hypothetical protein